MCTEGLHGLINKAAIDGSIRGVSLCRNEPKLTYLLFADDSLIFCRAKEDECQTLLKVLAKYKRASGQQINRAKTTLFFSKSTFEEVKGVIKDMLGVNVVHQYEKYLGLPFLVGRRKKESFTHIKQQVWKKIQGWEAKLLSQAGREILIKVVAQALPTYTMACFKLFISLCNEIESLICRFFWGQRGDNRKIHWVKWLDLCKPKTQGGKGFKDLSLFNDALLAKQTWRLLHDTSSLFYRVFKAKFFPNTSVMEAKVPTNASYAWKSLMKGCDVIKRGARWRIGSGRSLYIWGDNWLPFKAAPKVVSPKAEGSGLTMVSDLIDLVYKVWNEDAIDRNFFAFEATTIKNMPLCRSIQDDFLLWPFNLDGVDTVKSGYRFLYDEQCRKQPGLSEVEVLKLLWNRIWGFHVPNKIKHLAWKACKNALPTKLNLVCVKSSRMVAMMLAKHSRKMQSMPYSCALTYGPYGVQCLSGIMARSRRAPLLLTSLIVFLQVIKIRTCLRL